MKFLVEIDHVKSGKPFTKESARSFIEEVIYPTLARAEQLSQEGRILAGGPVAGEIALRFIVDVETNEQLDRIISSLPLWSISETKVTPLIDLKERRSHVQELLQRMTK